MDVRIDELQINVNDISGQEHRIGPVVERAVALLIERIRMADARARSVKVDALRAEPVNLNFSSTSDEQAAAALARTWFESLKMLLGG
jgi:CHASE2 domain-containing sensor protein